MDDTNKELWVKNSDNVPKGWSTVIGPDILYKKGDNLTCFFLHSNIVQEYKINGTKLLLNGKLENGQAITVTKEGTLKLSNDNSEFSYFKAGFVEKDSLLTLKDDRFYGKWYIDQEKRTYFLLEETLDENTGEKMMRFNIDNKELEGRWSLFSINPYIFLELNTRNGVRKIVIVDSVNVDKLKCHYLDLTGKRVEIKFIK